MSIGNTRNPNLFFCYRFSMPRIMSAIVLVLALSLPALAKKHPPAPVSATRGDKWADEDAALVDRRRENRPGLHDLVPRQFPQRGEPGVSAMARGHAEISRRLVRHVGARGWSVSVANRALRSRGDCSTGLQKQSKLPLLFAADFERGVTTRLMGTTNFPHAMAFGADGKAWKMRRISAASPLRKPARSACTGISFLTPM